MSHPAENDALTDAVVAASRVRGAEWVAGVLAGCIRVGADEEWTIRTLHEMAPIPPAMGDGSA